MNLFGLISNQSTIITIPDLSSAQHQDLNHRWPSTTIGLAFRNVHMAVREAWNDFSKPDWNSMRHFEKPASAFEETEEHFTRSFSFGREEDFGKTVTLSRRGRSFTVDIVYTDRAVTDATCESFEADGPVRISIIDGGMYLTSSRTLLAGQVKLHRTRFF